MSNLLNSSDSPASIYTYSLDSVDRIQSVWNQLQRSSPHSYFTSWGWMGNWIKCLKKPSDVKFVSIQSNGSPVCCFFIGLKSGVASRIFFKKRAYLNETGYPEYDDLVIEYNGVLGSHPGYLEELIANEEFCRIEEFQLSALTRASYDALKIPTGYTMASTRDVPSYFVDLDMVRASGQPYSQHLSRNRRNQLKQSFRHYEESGPVSISEAENRLEAIAMLADLEHFHQQSWNRRGKPGSFANEFFRMFHKELIESRFDSGEIQLLRIATPDGPIGFIYNFVYDNQVLHYQSGFKYGDSNASRPGLVSHYQAILHNLSQGRAVYNFLAGESQYKKSLSTNCDSLFYAVVARQGMKLRTERVLRTIWSKAKR